jgi:hypothetical protein
MGILDIAIGGPLIGSFVNSMLFMLEIVQVRQGAEFGLPRLMCSLFLGLQRAQWSAGGTDIYTDHGDRDDARRDSRDARCVRGLVPGTFYRQNRCGPSLLTSLQDCVTLWGNPDAFLTNHWPYPLLIASTAVTGIIVHLYLLRRIYSLRVECFRSAVRIELNRVTGTKASLSFCPSRYSPSPPCARVFPTMIFPLTLSAVRRRSADGRRSDPLPILS